MPCLEITTMVGCPLRCTYCPQDALKGAYGDQVRTRKYLALEDFQRMLAKVPRDVRIDFSGMSEPWANSAATDMLAHALGQGFNVSVYTTLFGMTDADRVIGLLVDHAPRVEAVVLHLPDESGNMRGFKPSPEYAAALHAFLKLRANGLLRWVDVMTMDAYGGVHPAIRDQVAAVTPWAGHARAGNLDLRQVEDQPVDRAFRHDGPVTCSFTPFYDHNVLLPNGDVVLCCMDYSLKHKLGNLLRDDYFVLFGSPGMSELQRENVKRGGSSLCASCNRAHRHSLAVGEHQFWRTA